MLAGAGREKPRAYKGMNANTQSAGTRAGQIAAHAVAAHTVATLGGFLRDRRARLRPGPDAPRRRRTPGLRREEVAARAGVSVTWYTWLEQGRGGPPSDEVLERLSRALELDAPARELLYLLAQQRPPPLAAPTSPTAVGPALQRVIEAMPASPAIIKTLTWDVVAWNAAAEAVLGGGRPITERNMLRRLFGDPAMRERLPDWEENARLALAVFRVDVARAGAPSEALALAEELMAASPDFRRLWAENDVGTHGFGQKRINHPEAGVITLEFSTFTVDGAEGLSMIVFAPAAQADARAIEALIARTGVAA